MKECERLDKWAREQGDRLSKSIIRLNLNQPTSLEQVSAWISETMVEVGQCVARELERSKLEKAK